LGNFAGYTGKDVPDPYFFNETDVLDGFEKVYTMIEMCIEDFMQNHPIKNSLNHSCFL
jgi:protein-tyrosine-phosphatase